MKMKNYASRIIGNFFLEKLVVCLETVLSHLRLLLCASNRKKPAQSDWLVDSL